MQVQIGSAFAEKYGHWNYLEEGQGHSTQGQTVEID